MPARSRMLASEPPIKLTVRRRSRVARKARPASAPSAASAITIYRVFGRPAGMVLSRRNRLAARTSSALASGHRANRKRSPCQTRRRSSGGRIDRHRNWHGDVGRQQVNGEYWGDGRHRNPQQNTKAGDQHHLHQIDSEDQPRWCAKAFQCGDDGHSATSQAAPPRPRQDRQSAGLSARQEPETLLSDR